MLDIPRVSVRNRVGDLGKLKAIYYDDFHIHAFIFCATQIVLHDLL